MKVIAKNTSEYRAICTKDMVTCMFELGQFLNLDTCTLEMDRHDLYKITCKKTNEYSSDSVTIEAKNLTCGTKYIILDKDGNLVDVIDKCQLEEQYAIIQENK